MNKRNIPLFCTGLLACVAQQSLAAPAKTPNIVIVFLDDMGYGDLSITGAKGYKTPNIDQLAHEGVLCTQFYVAQAVSSASRAGLLTGCYPNRIGINGALNPMANVGISDQEMTIAELLKQKNYACGIYGKWHLGHHRQFLPLQHGFDEYLGLPYSNDMLPMWYDGAILTPENSTLPKASFPPLPLIDGNEKVKELRTLEDQSQLTTLYTERTVSFIRKNKERPFFVYLPHSMPHNNNLKAVRNERWKLVLPHSHRSYENQTPGINGLPGETVQKTITEIELYDLRRDPGERYDVKNVFPEVVAELTKVAEEARDDLGDAITSREGRGRRPNGKLN